MEPSSPSLTAAQAAARLGVKVETLYAYVSRGLLSRTRSAEGSTFDPLEIEAFAERRSRPQREARAVPDRHVGAPLMVLETDIAAIEDDDLYFRGRRAAELAAQPFDTVATWLWGEPWDAERRLSCPDALVAGARRLVGALPASATQIDRAATAVYGLAAADPLRGDTSAGRLLRVGETLLAGIPSALSESVPVVRRPAVVDLLWHALARRPASSPERRALNAALVLTIDHDLAISTFAARVAASARATGYAVVSAALGALDSRLHGNASHDAVDLVRDVLAGTAPERAIRSHLRSSARGLSGFGHPLYRGVDPRAEALFEWIAELPEAHAVLEAVGALQAPMAEAGLLPNIDLALAALVVTADLPSDAGSVIFALGRTVGWIAHANSEYAATPMRLRPRGRYVGPSPGAAAGPAERPVEPGSVGSGSSGADVIR